IFYKVISTGLPLARMSSSPMAELTALCPEYETLRSLGTEVCGGLAAGHSKSGAGFLGQGQSNRRGLCCSTGLVWRGLGEFGHRFVPHAASAFCSIAPAGRAGKE